MAVCVRAVRFAGAVQCYSLLLGPDSQKCSGSPEETAIHRISQPADEALLHCLCFTGPQGNGGQGLVGGQQLKSYICAAVSAGLSAILMKTQQKNLELKGCASDDRQFCFVGGSIFSAQSQATRTG